MESSVLSPVALMGGLGMMLVGIGFVVYALTRRLGKAYLVFGAVAWSVTVAIKFGLALALNSSIYATLNGAMPGGLGVFLFELYVGFLTGITEVALVWLVMRYTRLGRVDWNHALAFGIGFGAFEAVLLGLGSFLTLLSALVSPQSFPAEILPLLTSLNNPLYGLAPIVERFFTIWVHILSNALILYGVARAQVSWFWIAFAYKSLIDAWAAFGQLSGRTSELGMVWILEVGIVIWGVIGWLGTRWIASRYPADAGTGTPRAAASAPAGE